MRVLADTHALYWYLISPDRLSPRSLQVVVARQVVPQHAYLALATRLTAAED